MYLLKVVRPGGAEELVQECARIFKTPLAEPGSWKLRLDFAGPRDSLSFTVPSKDVETIFIMSRHGDTVEILGKRPRPGSHRQRYRRDQQMRRYKA